MAAKIDPEKIENLLFHALRAVYLFERKEIAEFGINYQQILLLKILKRRQHLRVSEIAEELAIPVFSATRLIDQIERKKLIKRKRLHTDRRNILVSITGEGLSMARAIEMHAAEVISGNLKGFSGSQIDIIWNAVDDLDSILGITTDDVLT